MQSTPQRKRRPGGRRHFTRRKVCYFSAEKKTPNYKDVPVLRRFISDWGKIDSSRRTGTHARHQRKLAIAIKRARFLALLPHTGAHSRIDISRFDRGGDRGRRFTPREGGPGRYVDSGPVHYGPGGRIPPGTAPAAAPEAAVAVAEASDAPAEDAAPVEAAVSAEPAVAVAEASDAPAEDAAPVPVEAAASAAPEAAVAVAEASEAPAEESAPAEAAAPAADERVETAAPDSDEQPNA